MFYYYYYFTIFLLLLQQSQFTFQLQYRKQCIPDSIDIRYRVCSCEKLLNLNCNYDSDINEISNENQDPSVRSIKLSTENDEKRVYFPNLNYYQIKYEVVNLKMFPFIPKFAFYNEYHLIDEYTPYTLINFEYHLDIDAGYGWVGDDEYSDNEIGVDLVEKKIFSKNPNIILIDKHAFSGVNAIKVLIEGDFNTMKLHSQAFIHSTINEIQINCFTKLNIQNSKECMVEFSNEIQLYSVDERNSTRALISTIDAKSTIVNEMKFYGLTFQQETGSSSSSKSPHDWNIDLIPNINELKVLHIVNTKTRLSSFRKFFTLRPNEILKLTELNLRDNNVTELNEVFLMRAKLSNLVKLDLSNNLISSIELNTFKYLQQLETLDLSNNKLVYLSNAVFSGLKNLKNLILKSNLISNLIAAQFNSLPMLQFLDLSSNKITNLEGSNFIYLNNLNKLQIEFNPLQRVATDTFKYLKNLKFIDLTSKFDKDWFYFDNNDVCLLKEFKCKMTKILLSTEQNCNCFLNYVNIINDNNFETMPNDNTQFLRNCNVSCNHQQLLSTCFKNTSEDYSQSCLYNLLYPTTTTHTTTTTTTTTTIQTKTTGEISTKGRILDTIMNTAIFLDDDKTKNTLPSVQSLKLTNYVYLSIFLSCLSLVLLFVFSIVFSCMHAKYRKNAIYNIIPRAE
jgi:Leucine-rich repeat (LRR) protein